MDYITNMFLLMFLNQMDRFLAHTTLLYKDIAQQKIREETLMMTMLLVVSTEFIILLRKA